MTIEVTVRDLIQHAFPGVVVQHQATEHGLFGLDGMRRHLQGSGLQIVLLRSGDFVHGHLEFGVCRKTKGTTCKQDRARC